MNGTGQEMREVVREMLDGFQARTRLGIEYVAEELSRRSGRSFQPRTVYRYQEEKNGLQLPLATAIELSLICNSDLLLKEFARRLGYAVVRIPERNGKLPAEVAAIISALKETTEAIEASSAAIADGVITRREIAAIEKEIADGLDSLCTLREVLRERSGKKGRAA